MTRAIKIIYSKLPSEELFHDSSGTNILSLMKERNVEYDTKNTYMLKFELLNDRVVTQFIEVWNSYLRDNKYELNFNTYATLSSEEILQKQELMNEVISKINDYRYDDWSIPENLILELNGDDPQIDKLNALHKFFEDCSYYMINEKGNKHRSGTMTDEHLEYLNNLLVLLEKVNYLVHRMEGGASSRPRDFTVIRHATAKLRDKVELTRLDYKSFTPSIGPTNNGVIFLDYSTVGKDLEACWRTNDIELIQSQEVKQQKYINSAFNFTFSDWNSPTPADWQLEKVRSNNMKNQWCEENNVGDYYNYWEPEFNIGRIILGKCIDERIQDVVSYRDMLNHYPYIIDVIVE